MRDRPEPEAEPGRAAGAGRATPRRASPRHAARPGRSSRGPGGGSAGPGRSARGSTLVAVGILLSRLAGLVRERAITYYVGQGLAGDAFRAALRIPNVLQNLLGEGVLSASFIPVFTRLRAEGREEEARGVAGAVLGLLLAVAAALVLGGLVFAEQLTGLLARGFSGEKLALTVDLVRILTPGIGFLVLSAWCLGVLNSHRRFLLPYAAPVLWNAAIVTAVVVAGLRTRDQASLAAALAWGAFVGGALQFAVQVPTVRRLEPGLRPSLALRLPGVRQVLRALGPVVAGRGAVQILGYVELAVASLLAAGAVSALSVAQVLYLLPISVFGMSVAAAELPELASGERSGRSTVGRRLDAGLARIAFFVVPTMALYAAVGDLVVATLYEGGRFDRLDTLQVWAVLLAFTPGLLATTSSRLLQSALYATGDTRLPAVLSVARVALSVALGVLLMGTFDQLSLTMDGLEVVGRLPGVLDLDPALRVGEESARRLGAVGLALGASVSAVLENAALRSVVGRRVARTRAGGGQLDRIGAAALAAAVTALLVRGLVEGLPVALQGPVVVAVAGAVYLGAAALLRIPELRQLTAVLRR